MSDTPFPGFEANETDRDALADIIWFIKGRMSAGCGELGTNHIEALRRFRCDHPKIADLRHRCHSAEQREKIAAHFASLPKKGKK